MVTKEEVDKAKASAYALGDAADAAYDDAKAADEAADEAANEAWDKYVKLKREFENGS